MGQNNNQRYVHKHNKRTRIIEVRDITTNKIVKMFKTVEMTAKWLVENQEYLEEE